MKTFSAIALLALSLVSFSARAQSGMSIANWKDIKVGPMFTAGMSLNAGSVDTAWEASSGFAFALGAELLYPFSSNIGFDLGICYDSRNVDFDNIKTPAEKISYSASYLSFRPGFNLGGFTLGVGIGLPMGASTTLNNIAAERSKIHFAITSSDLNMLLEGRAGASVTLMENDAGGQLRLLIQGSYGFSKLLKDSSFPEAPQYTDKTKNNGPLATVQLGLAFLFDTNPH